MKTFQADTAAFNALASEQQHNRLLRLRFPNNDAPTGVVMLANRLQGDESLSRDFTYTVEVLSDSVKIAHDDVLGKMVTIELVREDGSLRFFNGYVFEFRFVKTDGGFVFYEMVLEPWLSYLKLRKDNAVYQNHAIREVTDKIFEPYLKRAWTTKVLGEDPPQTYLCQYEETDYNFLQRRWEAIGWTYVYRHTADGHRLVLTDDTKRTSEPIEGTRHDIPYQDGAGDKEDDGIREWQQRKRIRPTKTTLVSFNFKRPSPVLVSRSENQFHAAGSDFEIYENTGAYGFSGFDVGEELAKRRLQELDARRRQFIATGNDRTVEPGRWFSLNGHFSDGDARGSDTEQKYLIVGVKHEASNNYQDGRDALSSYKNEFLCIPHDVAWKPGRGYNSVEPKIFGVQTAIVTGPEGQQVHTDGYGRIKVQFHWDRAGRHNESSSAWIRVVSGWAGAEYGLVGLPRCGTEVTVQFLDGNVDRPLITGAVFNEYNMPPWRLPGQHALMGIRSRELSNDGRPSARGRSGHLIFDDTTDAIQTQLRSDHLHSQLSLGCITRIEDNGGRQDGRGEGFELRSDGAGVVRAAQGVLITTEPRPASHAHAKDMGETVQRLNAARNIQKSLATLAQQHGAQADQSDQSKTVNDLESQDSAIAGSGARARSFPELVEPHMVLASSRGIELTSSGSTHLASSEHIALSADDHIAIASGKSLFASVAHKFSLFVHQLGIKLIAASGKVQVQAQNDEMELLAKRVLEIISTTDWINIKAKQGIRINGGGSELEISPAGIRGYTAGEHHIYAADHQTMGPQSKPTEFPGFKVCPSQTTGAAQAGAASVPLS